MMDFSFETVLLPKSPPDGLFADTIHFIKQRYKYTLIPWKPFKPAYPHYMFLGSDRGILAYVELFYHAGGTAHNVAGFAHELKSLIRSVSLADSELDRPVFYLHIWDSDEHRTLYFETSEQIKNILFTEDSCIISDDSGTYFRSSLDQMGTFDELMTIFSDLKKHNVRYS